jgi:hypothetical protein
MIQNKVRPVFLVDAMLGNIAKKLRLFGFNSEYSSNIIDKDLIQRAKKENRILITKDALLSEIAQKQKISVIQITKNEEMEQLVQIFKKLKLTELTINGNKARCTECNEKLQIIDKEFVLNQVPEGIINNFDGFWKCPKCNKIFWEGTHIERLQKFAVELNGKL